MLFLGLFGVVFRKNKEPAFAGLKMMQAGGASLNLATSKYICTRVKIILILILLVIALAGLTVMEIRQKRLEEEEAQKILSAQSSKPSVRNIPTPSAV